MANKKFLRITAAALLLNGFGLGAGAPVQIWSSAELGSDSAALASAAAAHGIEGKTLGAYGNHSASIWRRAKSGEAELHRTKIDLIVIEEGEATLVYGGTIPNSHVTTANEVRGASIVGGESRKLASGDVIRIPAGVPHQFILAPGQTVAYFALKLTR